MKTYVIQIEWLFKGRYPLSSQHRVKASNLRAAVGKALAVKRKGYRETSDLSSNITISATVIGNGAGEEE